MKCERLVEKRITVFCERGIEMILDADINVARRWQLTVENNITVIEIYDVVKSIFEQSSEKMICEISVTVLGKEVMISRETTREEFLTALIGNVSCMSKITNE